MSADSGEKNDPGTETGLIPWDESKFKNSMGINANVTRAADEGETARRANRALNDIGDFIQGTNSGVLRDLTYMGSMAVHIYLAPTLNQLVCVSQIQPLRDTRMALANSAMRQLEGDCLEHYGRKRPKKRSGI